MLYKVFFSLDKVLKFNDFDENHSAILPRSTLLIPLYSGGKGLNKVSVFIAVMEKFILDG